MGPSTKAEWRQRMRALPVPTPEESRRVTDQVAELLVERRPRTVLTYLAMTGEVDLGELPGRLPHIRWVVTRTPEHGNLTVHPLDATLERHRLGFLQPAASAAVVDPEEIEVALIPGVAFDRRGVRLGRGKGHFDRFLSRLRPDALRVGITLDRYLVAELPAEAHDARVQMLATESGCLWAA
jgi:5-formyltetrahydrofolate cyclo-ligase